MLEEMTFRLDLKEFPPTSNTIKLHIYCAYLQAFVWYHAAIESTINIDLEFRGFTCDETKNLVPIINDASPLPKDFHFLASVLSTNSMKDIRID